MNQTKITCDSCGADLTTTGNCVDYRLAVTSEPIPSGGGLVTLMHVEPIIPHAAHFCGMQCLARWSKLERYLSKPPAQ